MKTIDAVKAAVEECKKQMTTNNQQQQASLKALNDLFLVKLDGFNTKIEDTYA